MHESLINDFSNTEVPLPYNCSFNCKKMVYCANTNTASIKSQNVYILQL